MEQVIVTDISCFTFSDLKSTNHSQIEPTCQRVRHSQEFPTRSVLFLFQKANRGLPLWCMFLRRMRYLTEKMFFLLFFTPPSVWWDEWRCSLAVQDLNERLSELHVEGGVYDGVHGAVHVAQPSDSVVHLGGNFAFRAVGVQDVCDEERQPAYDEDTWGETEREWGGGGSDKEGSSDLNYTNTEELDSKTQESEWFPSVASLSWLVFKFCFRSL